MGWKHIHYIALWMIAIYLQSLITRRPQVQVLSPQPCLTADFVRNQRFLFTFYTVLHNEQESIYGFCSLFVLYLVRAVLHFIAGYSARSRRAGFIFALCLGESVPRRHGCAFLGEYCAMRFPLVEWSIYGINRVYPNDTEKITRKAFHTGYKKNYETYHNYDTPY